MRLEKEQRMANGAVETKTQVEALERNEEKMREATKAYDAVMPQSEIGWTLTVTLTLGEG